MPIVIALLIWPLIEIALFVTVGGWLGLWLTLAIVLGTGIGGVLLMRWGGMRAMADLRGQMRAMGNPLALAADQAVFMLAGVLLVLPGFFTDAMGLLLLIPPVRTAVVGLMARRVQVRRGGADVIDGEYREVVPPAVPQSGPGSGPLSGPLSGPSGWTRH
jgi:UPF0716 protein FxsA